MGGIDGEGFRALRSGLDWFGLLVTRAVSPERFQGYEDGAELGAVVQVETRAGVMALEVRKLGRDVILKGIQGVRVLVRHPASVIANDGEEHAQRYGVEVQVQGVAFSAVRGGIGDLLVAAIWDGLAPELYRDQCDEGADVARIFEPFTRVGRCDFATDVQLDEGWAHREVYGSGDLDEAAARWSTRARKTRAEAVSRGETDAEEKGDEWVGISGRRSLLGKRTAGRTLYVGSGAYVLMCCYERSKLRTGDWSVLEPTLRAAGWDGSSLVLRAEARVSRRWMREQVPRLADGRPKYTVADHDGRAGHTARSLADLSLSEWMEELPAVVRELASRFRHVVESNVRRRDRASSPWWREVSTALASWSLCAGAGGELAEVASVRKALSLRRAVAHCRTSLERVEALSGGAAGDDHRAGLARSLGLVLRAVMDREWFAGREDRLERLRARYNAELVVGFSAAA